MDPLTIGLLVSTLVTATFGFLLNIYQSVKERHFHSECFGCELDYDSEHQDNEKKDEKK